MKSHDQFYSLPEAYDIAFDFKNIPLECDFLLYIFQRFQDRTPNSFLDIAAGPALHALEMARRGLSVAALDLSSEMIQYAQSKAQTAGLPVTFFQAKMTDFELPMSFDLAGIFMDSTSYLLTNEAVLQHLRSVATALNPKGLYILEMSHPRDVFSVGTSTINSWETSRVGLTVSVDWGDDADPFDPITQTTDTTVRLKIRRGDDEQQLVERAPQRCFTRNEFEALVLAEGSFEILEYYGAMKENVVLSNDSSSWRMIPILRKK